MPEYFYLFAAVCNAIEELEAIKDKLIKATQNAESLYISNEILLQPDRPE